MTKNQILDRVYRAVRECDVSDRSNDYDYGRGLVKSMFYDFVLSHSRNNKKADLINSLKARYDHLMKIKFNYQMHLGVVDELKRYDFINSL